MKRFKNSQGIFEMLGLVLHRRRNESRRDEVVEAIQFERELAPNVEVEHRPQLAHDALYFRGLAVSLRDVVFVGSFHGSFEKTNRPTEHHEQNRLSIRRRDFRDSITIDSRRIWFHSESLSADRNTRGLGAHVTRLAL